MLNPILAFSATRRMRSFKTILVVIAYVAALLLLALAFLGTFLSGSPYLNTLVRGPQCYLALLIAQFALIILIAPAMTSAAVAGERERQTLDLLLVTNTGSVRIVLGKVLESFAMLALLILCGLPVMSLCILTGGVSLWHILIGELFLLAEAFACVSIGVFCSSVSRSTVLSGVLSYLMILAIGVVTALPFLFGYPQTITDVVYDRAKYAALTPAGARAMISPLLYLNPGFGLICLGQGELHLLSSYADQLGWGRLLCTWNMADRAGWIFIALACAAGMLLISAVLIALSALMIRKGNKTVKNA